MQQRSTKKHPVCGLIIALVFEIQVVGINTDIIYAAVDDLQCCEPRVLEGLILLNG